MRMYCVKIDGTEFYIPPLDIPKAEKISVICYDFIGVKDKKTNLLFSERVITTAIGYNKLTYDDDLGLYKLKIRLQEINISEKGVLELAVFLIEKAMDLLEKDVKAQSMKVEIKEVNKKLTRKIEL